MQCVPDTEDAESAKSNMLGQLEFICCRRVRAVSEEYEFEVELMHQNHPDGCTRISPVILGGLLGGESTSFTDSIVQLDWKRRERRIVLLVRPEEDSTCMDRPRGSLCESAESYLE